MSSHSHARDAAHGHDYAGHAKDHSHGAHGHGAHGRGGHDHGGFGHSHAPTSFGRAFLIAIVLNTVMVAGEFVAGLIGGSVALVSDAAHNLSDVLGLVAAYAAMRLGSRAPSTRFTYGLGGSSILAALFNAVTLLLVTGALIVEAVQRLLAPEPVATGLVMMTAGAAILVNAASAWLLAPRGTGDLNVRAAAAHLAADAAVAAGVVVGAFVIQLTGWRWVDPALSLAINAMIVFATWSLLRESVALSLAGVPRSVEREAVRGYLAGLPGVEGLHDLHIWPLSTSETAMTVHLVMPAGHPGDVFLMEACHTLRERHGIGHATLQVETSLESACRLASHAA